MKAIIEIEITGDFEEPLSNDEITELLTDVIIDGATLYDLESSYRIIEIIKEDSN